MTKRTLLSGVLFIIFQNNKNLALEVATAFEIYFENVTTYVIIHMK
jgi:hypothetical protein